MKELSGAWASWRSPHFLLNLTTCSDVVPLARFQKSCLQIYSCKVILTFFIALLWFGFWFLNQPIFISSFPTPLLWRNSERLTLLKTFCWVWEPHFLTQIHLFIWCFICSTKSIEGIISGLLHSCLPIRIPRRRRILWALTLTGWELQGKLQAITRHHGARGSVKWRLL